MKLFIVAIPLLLLAACTMETPETENNPETVPVSLAECYTYINGKDSVILRPQLSGEKVSGTLAYCYFEKDQNKGSIQGIFKDDLLIAEYTFESEGRTSVRQVVFKKTPSGFVEGYGEITEKEGKSVFKSIDSLDYNHEMVLRKSVCDH